MERKIGEIFEFKGKIYKVIKTHYSDYSCNGCAFKDKFCYHKIINTILGECCNLKRRDKNNVIFKEIKDMEIKDNQLTINIPKGMEIDLLNSNFGTGVIKFKKKEITYEDIESSLKLNENMTGIDVADENVNKLCAISRLMCIAKFYNGDWMPDWSNIDESKFLILYSNRDKKYTVDYNTTFSINAVHFKHKEDALAVIENPNFREILDAIFKN